MGILNVVGGTHQPFGLSQPLGEGRGRRRRGQGTREGHSIPEAEEETLPAQPRKAHSLKREHCLGCGWAIP